MKELDNKVEMMVTSPFLSNLVEFKELIEYIGDSKWVTNL